MYKIMELERFIKAQYIYYNIALKEIINGKKTHWILFIFPQFVGLCFSYESYYYGIKSKRKQ